MKKIKKYSVVLFCLLGLFVSSNMVEDSSISSVIKFESGLSIKEIEKNSTKTSSYERHHSKTLRAYALLTNDYRFVNNYNQNANIALQSQYTHLYNNIARYDFYAKNRLKDYCIRKTIYQLQSILI